METNALKVMLWDDVAGYLTWDKSASVALFEYEPDFLTKNIDFAPLTMSVLSPRSQKGITLLNQRETTVLSKENSILWQDLIFERYAKEVDLPEDLIQQISKKLAQLSV